MNHVRQILDIIVNGSTPLEAYRGCGASCFYCILIVEILGDQIRRDSRIKGIRFEEVEIKSVQFADDMNLFSVFEIDSIQAAIN